MELHSYGKEYKISILNYFADGRVTPKKLPHGMFPDQTEVPDMQRNGQSDLPDLRRSREHAFLEAVMLSASDGMIAADLSGRIVFMNREAEILTGRAREDALGRPCAEVFRVRGDSYPDNGEDVAAKILGGLPPESGVHAVLVSAGGTEYPVEYSASPVTADGGEPDGVVIVFRDYTEYLQREKRIAYLSYNDQLTGLYNRRFYEEELHRLDTPRNLPIALIMADVNGLKLTNDAFGHKAGDELLQRIAGILSRECREDDILARIGGDEFVILLPRTDAVQAQGIVERIHEAVAAEKPDKVIPSVSTGLAVKTDPGESMTKIFADAEDNMYRHKLTDSPRIKSRTIVQILSALFENNKREMDHSKRVGRLSGSLAAALRFEKEAAAQVRIAGLLHDIGHIGIDENILKGDRPLSDSERLEVRKHPEIGYHILSSINEFSEIAIFVLQHQERWDGAGYPKGLAREEITQQARIIAVADAFDAMTSGRHFGVTYTEEEAIGELEKEAGRQFDPSVAKVFVEKVLKKEWHAVSGNNRRGASRKS